MSRWLKSRVVWSFDGENAVWWALEACCLLGNSSQDYAMRGVCGRRYRAENTRAPLQVSLFVVRQQMSNNQRVSRKQDFRYAGETMFLSL